MKGLTRKSSRLHGAHKRLAIGSPQAVEPDTLDSPYALVSDFESIKTDDNAMCLDFGEEGAPTNNNDSTSMEEMERVQQMCVDVRKMCIELEQSLAMGIHWIMQGLHLKTRIFETMHFPKQHTLQTFLTAL